MSLFGESRKGDGRRKTFVVGFSAWKKSFRGYFPDRDMIFFPKDIKNDDFEDIYKPRMTLNSDAEVFIWGNDTPNFIKDFLKNSTFRTFYIEDGFVRSVKLGATKAPPMSLSIDSRTPYFNAREASDLEVLLKTYNFDQNPALMERAEKALALFLDHSISKYNFSEPVDVQDLYGIKDRKRVLVVGQVEGDASIVYGCSSQKTNNDVVKLAAKENPGAQILYKPHPDVLNGLRPEQSSPKDVEHLCQVLTQNLSLPDALKTVDHVYTITSLAGFEASLRGIKTTTIGCPFYAGWGFTDDRQPNKRRTRTLSPLQVFAASYLLYPKYFDPETGKSRTFEETIVALDRAMRDHVAEGSGQSADAEVIEGKAPAAKAAKPAAKQTNAPAAKQAKPETGLAPEKIKSGKPGSAKPVPAARQAVEEQTGTPSSGLPNWYRPTPGPDLSLALRAGKPVFLSVHAANAPEAVLSELFRPEKCVVAPFDFFDSGSPEARTEMAAFAATRPEVYRKLLLHRMTPLIGKIAGVIFYNEASPATRIIATVCEDLSIPRILIPELTEDLESGLEPPAGEPRKALPLVDMVLGWSEQQKAEFLQAGFPSDRYIVVGTPQTDRYHSYKPRLSRAQFCRIYQVNPDRKIVLVQVCGVENAGVPARPNISQSRIVEQLNELAQTYDVDVVVRMPASAGKAEFRRLKDIASKSEHVVIDEADYHLVPTEEALSHADLVISVQSQMLLGGLLLGRPVLLVTAQDDVRAEMKGAEIPMAILGNGLVPTIRSLLEQGWTWSEEGKNWVAGRISSGVLDGKSAKKVADFLKSFAEGRSSFAVRPAAVNRLLSGEAIDTIGIPSTDDTLARTQKFLRPMVKAGNIVQIGTDTEKDKAVEVELFLQWGIRLSNKSRIRQREIAKDLNRPIAIIEDGFLRSVDIGLSGTPTLSIIVDDVTAHYDATKVSRLSRLLQSDRTLTRAQMARSRAAIRKIAEARVSKYNHAPDLPIRIGSPDRRKVLLIDQRYGDQSVESGLADASTFNRMLHDVIRDYEDCDIIVKQHPDAIKGGKSSYFNQESLQFTKYLSNVFMVDFDVNPHALFDLVDEVFVVTSGMGFEALMRGKKVHCYGMPFYAGWGATSDKLSLPTRTRQRSVEEIFHFAYIECSRYYHPDRQHVVDIEDLIDHIAEKRVVSKAKENENIAAE